MIRHLALGDTPFSRSRALKILLDKSRIRLAGNSKLKIYGSLQCTSGKRMNVNNRVFFKNEAESLTAGYRPCGHCMRQAYIAWKQT